MYGEQPSLTKLRDGDLAVTTDFRSVYATLLEDVLGTEAASVLEDAPDRLPLLTCDAALLHTRSAARVADGLAELQVRWPSVPIMFAETHRLAEEWTYRWLAAALTASQDETSGARRLATLAAAGRLDPRPVAMARVRAAAGASTAEVRAWALDHGMTVSDRGRLRPDVWAALPPPPPPTPPHQPTATSQTDADDPIRSSRNVQRRVPRRPGTGCVAGRRAAGDERLGAIDGRGESGGRRIWPAFAITMTRSSAPAP